MGAHGSKVGDGKLECPYSDKRHMGSQTMRVKSEGIASNHSYHSQATDDGESMKISEKGHVRSVREAISSTVKAKFQKKVATKKKHVVEYLFPVYYVDEPLTVEEVEIAKQSWELIADDLSPQWIKNTAAAANDDMPDFKYRTCQEWFQTIFYERLFDVHPISKSMFKNPKNQGIFLVALFSFVFTSLEYPKAFNDRLEHLAETHSKKGIKAVEYGIIGEVLFWTLQQCLGPEGYALQVHGSWVKLFSNMLKVIVPSAVKFELRDKSVAQKLRADTQANKYDAYCYDASQDNFPSSPAPSAAQMTELEKKLNTLAMNQSPSRTQSLPSSVSATPQRRLTFEKQPASMSATPKRRLTFEKQPAAASTSVSVSCVSTNPSSTKNCNTPAHKRESVEMAIDAIPNIPLDIVHEGAAQGVGVCV